MADLYSMVFMLQFIVAIGIVGVEFYNLMRVGTFYGIRTIFLLFVGFFVCYVVGFVVMILGFDEMLYVQLFNLERFFVLLHMLFFICSILIKLGVKAMEAMNSGKAYNSLQMRIDRGR